MILKISDLNVVLNGLHILQDINLHVNKGELVVAIGANGAGKSVLLRTISGLHSSHSGHIQFLDNACENLSVHDIASQGICLIPENRQLFSGMTARENLLIGAYRYRKDRQRVQRSLARVYEIFPIIEKYENRIAASFSGGEQQMISIGRGLMSEPSLMMIDEMSLGLAPLVIQRLFNIISELNQNGMSILLVEQNAHQALRIAHRALLKPGEFIVIGMDTFYISWTPFYQNLYTPHYFLARKENEALFTCLDTMHNQEHKQMETENIIAHAFDLYYIFKGEEKPLCHHSEQQEARAVLNSHPQTQDQILAKIAECVGENRQNANLLAKYIDAMIKNRCLYFYHLNNQDLFTKDLFKQWMAVKHGLYKASLITENENLLDALRQQLKSLISTEIAIATKILKAVHIK